MKNYEFVDTEASSDVAFMAYGESLEELFRNAALAVAETTVVRSTVKQKIERTIELDADSSTDLLYDWLEEIVFVKDAEGLLLVDFEPDITENTGFKLTARAVGDKIDYESQDIRNDIKAVTLHKFRLEKTDNGWEAYVLLDL